MAKATSNPPNFVARTIPEVARVLDVSPRRVSEYLAMGMPGKRDAYDLAVIVPWLREHVWTARLNESSPDGQRMAAAQLRKAEAAAMAAEVRAKKEIGEVVDREMIMAGMGTMAAMFRSRLQAIAPDLGLEIPSDVRDVVVTHVESRVNLALVEMSQWSDFPAFKDELREIEARILKDRAKMRRLMTESKAHAERKRAAKEKRRDTPCPTT